MTDEDHPHHPPIAQPFGALDICDEHFEKLCNYLNKVRRRTSSSPLAESERAVLRDRFEELAALFLLHQRYLKSGKTPSARKHALKRLESAARRFLMTLKSIDRSTWLSLYMRLQDPPEGFNKALSDYAFGDGNARDLYRHFSTVAAIGKAAGQARDGTLEAKRATRKYEAVKLLVLGANEPGLALLYEEATGRPARAHASRAYRHHPLGARATPFVRFIAEFIRPFAPELCTSGLGDAVHRALTKNRRRKRANQS